MILGKACDLIDSHQLNKQQTSNTPKHEKGAKGEKPDKDQKSSKSNKNSESERVETIGPDIVTDKNNADLDVDDTKISLKPAKDASFCSATNLPEGRPELEDFSLGCNSVFFDNSSILSPQFIVTEKLDSISKSSSIILEEEEEEEEEEEDDSKSRSESGMSEEEDNDVAKAETEAEAKGDAGAPMTPTQAEKSDSQHRWSNSRSTKFLVARGEFNKSVYSDSRRRPLSCTPPSTSLSTSASVDDDDDAAAAINVVNGVVSATASTEDAQTVEIFSSNEEELSTINSSATFLPDLLLGQLGQQRRDEGTSEEAAQSEVDDQSVQVSISGDNDGKDSLGSRKDSDASSMTSRSLGPRSVSSPDFLLQYQEAFDPDRDWPQVDDGYDDVDAGVPTAVVKGELRRDTPFEDQVKGMMGSSKTILILEVADVILAHCWSDLIIYKRLINRHHFRAIQLAGLSQLYILKIRR